MLKLYRRPRVGLALSGGGARGLAHIGVLKVLEREGVPIDYLAGTSMGGIIAAGCAAGFSAEYMAQEALRMSRYTRLLRLFDLSLPGAGLVEGKKVQAYLAQHLRERAFSDLRIPLALVAVDLLKGQEVVLTEGRVADAVRATISIPGVFAPVRLDGRLLVDGGVLNNLPADVVRRMGADVVIAVDVSVPFETRPELLDLEGQSLPLTQVPLAMETLRRTVGVMMAYIQTQKLAQAQPEVLIRPEIANNVTLVSGFNRAAEIIAVGEQAAEAVLPHIRQMLHRRFWPSLVKHA